MSAKPDGLINDHFDPTPPLARLKLSSTGDDGSIGDATVTVQLYVAVADRSAASIALTVKVCGPVASEPYDWVVGVLHRTNGRPSREQRVVETASLVVNEKRAVVADVVLGGVDPRLTLIGVGSSAIAETVPVALGPPGWSGKGG